jgi:hypothetical protein
VRYGKLGCVPRIQQIIPADGWYAVYQRPSRASGLGDRVELEHRPLVGWALVPQEPERTGGDPDDQVVGLVVDQTGIVTVVDETAESFEGYQQLA